MTRGTASRRNYEQVTTDPEAAASDATTTVSEEAGRRTRTAERRPFGGEEATALTSGLDAASSEEVEEDADDLITIVILDITTKKFPVQISARSTVKQLKAKGRAIHKVPADRQRLIFHGRQLVDDKTLAEEKITDQVIVHLFPKPRVLIKNNETGKATPLSRDNSTAAESTDSALDEDEEGGARVPTIIMNADEAQQRSQILVLGSSEYLEASNNVKLFSFMLLILSSIELINLLAIALGVPQNDPSSSAYPYPAEDDTIFPDDDNRNGTSSDDGTGTNVSVEPWTTGNTFDFIISVMGVYVAILGLKAASLNTLRLARLYLMGTFATGVGWCLYNYVMAYKIDREVENNRQESHDTFPPVSDSDLAKQALTVMVLPCMVWILCCLRAWQFQHLLREAEQEAEDRIRSELDNITGEGSDEEEALPAELGTMA
jgi:hypothetical protein